MSEYLRSRDKNVVIALADPLGTNSEPALQCPSVCRSASTCVLGELDSRASEPIGLGGEVVAMAYISLFPARVGKMTGGSIMSESLTLHIPEHGKLGLLHCGVTREGFVSVAGETHDIADGETVQISRVPVRVTRRGDEYTFTREV
jgi:hypothetical protein